MSDQMERKRGDRPFPWLCATCHKEEVYPDRVPYTIKVRHDDVVHSLKIEALEVPKCRSCGTLLFSDRADDQISDALRSHLQLLTPAQIAAARTALMLSQAELAAQLGVAEKSVSDWEEGMLIQSRAMDDLLRKTFAQKVSEVLNGKEEEAGTSWHLPTASSLGEPPHEP